MTAHQNAGTPPDARADRAPLHRGRRRPAVRWIAHGVLFVAQAVSLGCYAQLYRRVLRPGLRRVPELPRFVWYVSNRTKSPC
jgi:hypothetical protein